jgi:hypothetical protein
MSTPREELEAMRGLSENWDGYGAAPPNAPVIDFAQEFLGFLEAALRRSGRGASTLHVSPTRVGGVLLEWDDPTMEHEVEINPDLGLRFLHLHKVTGQITTRRFEPGAPTAVDPGGISFPL